MPLEQQIVHVMERKLKELGIAITSTHSTLPAESTLQAICGNACHIYYIISYNRYFSDNMFNHFSFLWVLTVWRPFSNLITSGMVVQLIPGGDIYDGAVYQQFVKNGFLASRYHISLLFNTDGIPVFRSSAFAFWSLFLLVN